MISKNYDGILTKSRTMLEEVFIYIIGKEYNKKEYNGKIQKLFEKAKSICNINKTNVPKPVEDIVTCLNSIVNDVAQIRNDYSESHGVGQHRIQLSVAETMLVINSAVTLAEYLLSVYSDSSSLNDRVIIDDSGVDS